MLQLLCLTSLFAPHQRAFLRTRAARLCIQADTPLSRCSERLLFSADAIVAAAAVLGENQRQEEEPGRLSSGGCALANVARDCALVGAALDEKDWEAATEPLAAVAVSLSTAAASLEGLVEGTALSEAAYEIEDASCVTGCISLAAAAGPNLEAAGELVGRAGGALRAHGEGMLNAGTTAAHVEAGNRLCEAGGATAEAGEHMAEAGRRLEAGLDQAG